MRLRRQEYVDKITACVDRDFFGDPVSRKKHDGIGGADGDPHSEIWIQISELHSAERWEIRSSMQW